MQGQGH